MVAAAPGAASDSSSSPLHDLRGFLRLYCLLGIIPGQLSPDGCSFKVKGKIKQKL